MKHFLYSSAILVLSFGRLCSSALPAPTNHWTFEGDATDSIAGIEGTLSGSAAFSHDVFTEGSESLHLPCCNSRVVLNHASLQDAFSHYTVSLWFYAEATGGRRYLYEEGAATNGLAVRLNDMELEAAVIEGGGGHSSVKAVAAPVPIATNKWHHAVLTYANGVLSITLDGSASSSTSTGFGQLASHGHAASIGGGGVTDWASTLYFEGYVDDLRIYDGIALTSSQISELYSGPVTALPAPTNRWRFEGDATDSIAGIEGSLSGSAAFSHDVFTEGSESLHLPCCESHVDLNHASLGDALSYYTVSLWFYAEATGGRRYLYEEGAATNGLAVRLNDKELEAAVIEGGGGHSGVKAVAAPVDIETDKWHHAVLTYAEGELSITLDGSASSSMSAGFGQLASHGNGASIGGGGLSDWSSTLYFEGYVDDLRIYDGIALTSSQISELYSEYSGGPVTPATRPNFLIIVGDDVNYDSAGFMGGVAPNVSPHLDQLASESRVFTRSHTANSVCQPSRQAMLSGKYPPNYGSVGFFPMAEGTETVVTRLRDAGYLTASFNKLTHMLPSSSFPWDMTEDNTDMAGKTKKKIGRSPTLLGEATKETIAAANAADKPFFLLINSADTHKPFAGHPAEALRLDREHIDTPSRTYDPDEVTIPSPLPDLPDVRNEFAQYASSMRRLDDTVGRCLDELDDAGLTDNTVVMYMSDNGMPMPFGKFDTYRDSLSSPLIIRWPGRFAPEFDNDSLVSLTDITPTVLDMAGLPPLVDADGRSLVPLVDGEEGLVWRDVVVGTRYEDIWYGNGLTDDDRAELREQGWVDAPEHTAPGTMKRTMNKRGITDGTYHYIFNHFYDPDNMVIAYPYGGGRTFDAMEELAQTDGDMADRMEFYTFRAPEEFYNTVADPGAMHNLVDDPTVADELVNLKNKLLTWMQEVNDPVLDDYTSFLSR